MRSKRVLGLRALVAITPATWWRRSHFATGLVACLAIGRAAIAQETPPPLVPPDIDRPVDRAPSAPLPEPRGPIRERVLPAIPEPSLDEIQGDAPDAVLFVEAVEIEGNTAIPSSRFEAVTAPFLGRALAAEGIEALRRRITQVYVEAGYVNSGAVIPPQDVSDGRLRVRIIEGRVESIRFRGLEHYRDGVLRARVARGLDPLLNIEDVETQLRLLDQDPRIEQINARLRPGSARSASVVEITILERDPRQLSLRFDNYGAPAVGAYTGRLGASHDNVFGFGDRFGVDVSRSEGLTRLRASYEMPLHASGTRLVLNGSFGEAMLVEDSLRALDVESSDASLALGLAQTIWHTPSDRIDLSALFERRRSKTEFGGEGLSFVAGPQSGRSEVSVVRASVEWVHRGLESVVAIRSMGSFGTDLFNPTVQRGGVPDGLFVSWFGQLRAVYRLPWGGLPGSGANRLRRGMELSLRGDIQLADRPLLSLEQFSIGGPGSVRGYRRNQLVRDQGFTAGLDLRIPLWRSADARTILALTPFVDLGKAWNRDRGTPGKRTLSGVGAGIEWRPHRQLELEVMGAWGIRHAGTSGDLQDRAIYLRANWWAF